MISNNILLTAVLKTVVYPVVIMKAATMNNNRNIDAN